MSSPLEHSLAPILSVPSLPEYSLLSVTLLFSTPALGGALFGYDIGATSFAILQMADADLSGTSWWRVVADSPACRGLVVAAASAGALLGSAAAFLTTLLAGRLVYGVGVGVTMHGAPTYLSEQSPSSIRGLLVSLKEACIVLGMLVGYAD